MAELSQIKINGVLYDIKDSVARETSGVNLEEVKEYVNNQIVTEVENKVQDVVKDTIEDNTATDEDIDSMFQ